MTVKLTEYDRYKLERAKAWLYHVRRTARRMDEARERYDEKRRTIDMVGAQQYGERVQTSGRLHGDDRIVAYLAQLDEIAGDMTAQYAEYVETMSEARVVFAALTTPDGHAAMAAHWIYGDTWTEVARRLGCSEAKARLVGSTAALECYGLMPRRWRDPMPPAI